MDASNVDDVFAACVTQGPPPPTNLADALLETCGHWDWQQPHVTVFGATHPTPRLTYYTGPAPYRYSRHTHHPQIAPNLLLQAQTWVSDTIAPVNCCLANLYRNGHDTMGFHSDDEPCFGPDPTIVTVSLGAARDVVFKPKPGTHIANTSPRFRGVLPNRHGDVWVMRGPCQRLFAHGVPARKRVTDPRVSLTFRLLLN